MNVLLIAILIACGFLFFLGFISGFFQKANDEINIQYFNTKEEFDKWAQKHDK